MEKVIISRGQSVTIYAERVGNTNRLGQFTVFSDFVGNKGGVFLKLSDAEVEANKYKGLRKP